MLRPLDEDFSCAAGVRNAACLSEGAVLCQKPGLGKWAAWDGIWAGQGTGAGAALAGFGHSRFMKDRAHSLLLPWRGAGLREAGKRTSLLAEPLPQNKLLQKSGEMPASGTI